MIKLRQIKPEAVEIVIGDAEMIKFIQQKDEPVFEVVNPKKEHGSSAHPLLGVEIALRGCELSGVFTERKRK